MAERYLCRHGETDYNRHRIFQGVALALPLNEQGQNDAERLRNIFLDVPLDGILCSPAVRTRQTIEPLLAVRNLPVRYDPNLVERSHGVLEGMSYAHIPDLFAYFYHNGNREGGEPLEDALARAEEVKRLLEREFAQANVLVMSHGAILSLLCNAFQGHGLTYHPQHVLSNGHVHHYTMDDSGNVLRARLNLERL